MHNFLAQVEPDVEGVEPRASARGFAELSEERLREIGIEIQRIAAQLLASVKRDKLSPNEIEIEFGVTANRRPDPARIRSGSG